MEKTSKKLTRAELVDLYSAYEQDASDADFYEQRANQYAIKLEEHGINPDEPPQWLLKKLEQE